MNEDLNYELSEHIKYLRFKSEMNQECIAKKLKVSRNTYSIWENNSNKIKFRYFNRNRQCFRQ